ncbi:MAG: beta-lactamase family protein [Theionarchaea archaeon]|nr:beta-lactamase family protein [Theionarchaea archaeon]
MDLERAKEQHNLITKELENLDFGKVYLQFMTEMPKKGCTWLQEFIREHRYESEDEEKKETLLFLYIFRKLLAGEQFYFINSRNISEKLIEVDFFTSKSNVILFSKMSRKSTENMDVDLLKITFPGFEDMYQDNTLLSLEEAVTKLNRIFDELEEKNIFSGSVGITRNDEFIFRRSSGEADMRYHVPNNEDTKFNLGSMNKIFTAVAILQLYEQKKLDLLDTVATFLPEFPHGDEITIHHLLSHTSGLGSFWNEKFEQRFKNIRSIDDYMDLFIEESLLFQPGERFEYSNAGFIVLGKIIEVITGTSYDEYVQQHIYDAAGMQNTCCYEIDRIVPNLAMGYTHDPDIDRGYLDHYVSNFLMIPVKGSSAGGGYSTLDDLVSFARALKKGDLISRHSLDMMQEPPLTEGIEPRQSEGYGYGCQTGSIGKNRFYGHGGGAPGVATMLMIFPDIDVVVALLSNWDPMYEIFAEQQILNIVTRVSFS